MNPKPQGQTLFAVPVPAGVRYSPFGTNSNSFAHQAVQVLGLPNPTPQTWEPSWNVPLPVPDPHP